MVNKMFKRLFILLIVCYISSQLNCQGIVQISSPSRIQNKLKTSVFSEFVFFDEVSSRLKVFPDQLDKTGNGPDIRDFNEIAIDYENQFAYVGAKNFVIKLSFTNSSLKLLNRTSDLLKWEPYYETINDCRSTRVFNAAKYCQNYIRLLQLDTHTKSDQKLLICGTYAGRPTCTYRNMANLQETLDTFDGIGKCPNSPEASLAYLSASNGDHYFATSIDYSEQGMRPDYLIDRSMGPSNQIRTDQFNSNWLNDPVFVASIEIGNYVYFFMRETAIEYMNCGQKIYSRVVRLCKYDQGSKNYNVWKSFEKARLTCSVPGTSNESTDEQQSSYKSNHQYPFYYDEIQNVYYDKQDTLIYAIFTTPMNGVKGSAVCVYNVDSLDKAFDGPFKHQKTQNSIWEPLNKPMEKQKCEPSMEQSTSSTKYAHKYQLKHHTIQPIHHQPLLVIENHRISKLVVDTVLTKHNNHLKMLFIATEYNTILKYMILNLHPDQLTSNKKQPTTSCLLEELEILDPSTNPIENNINNLVLLNQPNQRHLLIATNSQLIKLSVANCDTQTNYFSCLSLMNPYCLWNSKSQKCVLIYQTAESLESGSDSKSVARNIFQNNHLHQHSINGCPVNDVPIDGGYSEWSEWSECMAQTGEKCQCRMRLCNSPTPRNGGKNCDPKTAIEILNCQVNGGWTHWSAWSACKSSRSDTQTCDLSSTSTSHTNHVRTRFRTCTNPEPKFNGRICIGLDQEEEPCTAEMINPCVKLVSNSQWMHWGAWEACSKNCGGGFQMRRRLCNSKICLGCNQEWRTCNSEPCQNKIESIQSDWDNVEQIGQQKLEQRNKFTCKFDSLLDANGLDGMELNASTEYRICNGAKSCHSIANINEIGKFTEWTEWSNCVNCQDHQYRTRKCRSSHICFGPIEEKKKCTCKPDIPIDQLLINRIIPQSFRLIHLIIACVLTFLMGSLLVLLIICLCFKTKSKTDKSLCCCIRRSKHINNSSFSSASKNHITDKYLSNSLGDQNSLETDTANSDVLNSDSTKLQYCMASSDSSSTSNHSKEYFTIANRFDQGNLTSLLNGTIPDDTEDELNTFQMSNNLSGTLGRNAVNKMNQNNLPNKSFNTYATSNKNAITSGLNLMNSRLSANAASINATNRLSNQGSGTNAVTTGSIRATLKHPRNSFAFTMRTNLDQEL